MGHPGGKWVIIIFQKNREETMEEQKKTKEATITLDLTVEEFLFNSGKNSFSQPIQLWRVCLGGAR